MKILYICFKREYIIFIVGNLKVLRLIINLVKIKGGFIVLFDGLSKWNVVNVFIRWFKFYERMIVNSLRELNLLGRVVKLFVLMKIMGYLLLRLK